MKIIVLLILTGTMAYGQIEVDNGHIVWTTVKQYENSSESLLKQIKSSGKFSTLELIDDTIIGKFTDIPINFQGTASMYLMTSNMMGSFMIQFKDSRYRITAKNLQFKSQTSVGVFDQGSIEPIEQYALNRDGEFRKRIKSKDLPIVEDNLSKLFEFSGLSQKNDW